MELSHNAKSIPKKLMWNVWGKCKIKQNYKTYIKRIGHILYMWPLDQKEFLMQEVQTINEIQISLRTL